MSIDFATAATHIIAAGQFLNARHWAPATSGNYSLRLNNGNIAITVSGRHKGRLTAADIMQIDMNGNSVDGQKPSDESPLHVALYARYPHINAVVHTHSNEAVCLSRRVRDNSLELVDYELLKALPTVDKRTLYTVFPVVENSQDTLALASIINHRLTDATAAYIIRNHGVYSWGTSMEQALNSIEATEHLIACVLHEGQK